jgi:pescadillo protein
LESDDRIFSLAFPIKKTEKAEPEVTIDSFPADDVEGENLAEKMRQMQTLKTLFSECKFFLNREVPKESLAFIIRSWLVYDIR